MGTLANGQSNATRVLKVRGSLPAASANPASCQPGWDWSSSTTAEHIDNGTRLELLESLNISYPRSDDTVKVGNQHLCQTLDCTLSTT